MIFIIKYFMTFIIKYFISTVLTPKVVKPVSKVFNLYFSDSGSV